MLIIWTSKEKASPKKFKGRKEASRIAKSVSTMCLCFRSMESFHSWVCEKVSCEKCHTNVKLWLKIKTLLHYHFANILYNIQFVFLQAFWIIKTQKSLTICVRWDITMYTTGKKHKEKQYNTNNHLWTQYEKDPKYQPTPIVADQCKQCASV